MVQASMTTAQGLSSCTSRVLERRLSSCSTWALVLRRLWDLPGPGIEPVSPALAGGFLATDTPGKPAKVSSKGAVLLCIRASNE